MISSRNRRSVAVVAAVPMSLQAFMRPHLLAATEHFDTSAICSDISGIGHTLPAVTCHKVDIRRNISLIADLAALWSLMRLFRRQRFDLVHSVTPKAGLLAMMAAWLSGVPVRIHIFTGQVWATRRGPSRWLLKTLDLMIASLATHILVDSPSQRDFLIAEGILTAEQSEVLGGGSICGVDPLRFTPAPSVRLSMRAALGIPCSAVVFLYLGRLNPDKGIRDLTIAFASVAAERKDVWLLVVGPDEGGEAARVRALCAGAVERLLRIDFTPEPERYMQCADVFCLPSYREGFGSSVIEAAACGLPAIASRIYGLTDAVEDGHTGLLHPPRDVDAIAACIRRFAESPALRHEMGQAARSRAVRFFSQSTITNELMRVYQQKLEIKT